MTTRSEPQKAGSGFAITSLAVFAVIALAACGGGGAPSNWYANGKAYAIADYNAGDTAKLIGLTEQQFCQSELVTLGNTNAEGVPLNRPPGTTGAAVAQWVAGCVAGEATVQHP